MASQDRKALDVLIGLLPLNDGAEIKRFGRKVGRRNLLRAVDDEGHGLLWHAVDKNDPIAAELLLANGFGPGAFAVTGGRSPYQMAYDRGHDKVLSVLRNWRGRKTADALSTDLVDFMATSTTPIIREHHDDHRRRRRYCEDTSPCVADCVDDCVQGCFHASSSSSSSEITTPVVPTSSSSSPRTPGGGRPRRPSSERRNYDLPPERQAAYLRKRATSSSPTPGRRPRPYSDAASHVVRGATAEEPARAL